MSASALRFASFVLVTLGWSVSAYADEPVAVPPAGTEATAVVRPAPVSVDIRTGAESVVVPLGCSPVRQPSGQLVVLCPFAAPKLEAPAVQAALALPPPPPKKTRSEWYGWQILLVDGASLASGLAVGLAGKAEPGAAVGLTGYALGAPIVHWANGQVGAGFGSLALRVGTPISMAFWGYLAFAVTSDDPDAAGLAAGASAIVGMAAAMVVDVAVLAKKQVPIEAPRAGARRKPQIQWTPTAGYDGKREAVTVGLAGSF